MKPGKKPQPPIDRWLAFVDKTETCWLWTGATQPNGYGRFGSGEGRRIVFAHRWSYEHFVGPIPAGLTIDHICRVRNCVNPRHLRVMTQSENSRRAGLLRYGGRCIRGHSTTDDANVYIVKHGKRQCRECSRIRSQARFARQRAERKASAAA